MILETESVLPEHMKPWPPPNRAPLPPLPSKPEPEEKEPEAKEPGVRYYVVRNVEYATLLEGEAAWSDEQVSGHYFAGPETDVSFHERDRLCETNDAAKAHATKLANEVGGRVLEVFDEPYRPDTPTYRENSVEKLLAALEAIRPGPMDACPLCHAVGYHKVDCDLAETFRLASVVESGK